MSTAVEEARRLVQDDDCSWYLRPYEQADEFAVWVEQVRFGSVEAYDGDDFECYMIDGPHVLKITACEDES